MIIMGVDPGVTAGGIAIYANEQPVAYYRMPVVKAGKANLVNMQAVMSIVHEHNPDVAYVEMQHTRPGHGHQFTHGRNFGRLEASILLTGCRMETVEPNTWKRQVLGTVKGKEPAIKYCKIFSFPVPPLGKTDRSTKPHDGIAEAWCIAVYGEQTEKLKGMID